MTEIIDTFAGGIRLTRGKRYLAPWPYKQEVTYMYPGMGVSMLTNAIVSGFYGSGMQYPASLLEEVKTS